MKLSLDTVIAWVKTANMAIPEAKRLYDNLLLLFSETDQNKLKDALAEASARADASHAARQERLRKVQEDDGA